MDFDAARAQLKRIRDGNLMESENVLDIWNSSLCKLSYKLGDEIWMVYEQVFLAALDASDEDTAYGCIQALQCQFPESIRVSILEGMYKEFKREYEDAQAIYEDVMKRDPTNTAVLKRKVAIHKSQQRNADAIRELSKYLEKYQADFEAWNELCLLYLTECDYKKAAFCMEELILSNPHNHVFMSKYAEIKYTEGGTENMEIAMSYFSQALQLNPNNLRAIYGLYLSANNLTQTTKNTTKTKKHYQELSQWAWKEIMNRYRAVMPLESLMGNLHLTAPPNGPEKMT